MKNRRIRIKGKDIVINPYGSVGMGFCGDSHRFFLWVWNGYGDWNPVLAAALPFDLPATFGQTVLTTPATSATIKGRHSASTTTADVATHDDCHVCLSHGQNEKKVNADVHVRNSGDADIRRLWKL